MHDIRLACADADIASTFRLMVQLRTHLSETEFVPLIQKMKRESGYRLVALRTDEAIGAVAGFRITDSLAWGHYIYVDDLITDDRMRSRGYGEALLDWIAEYGKAQGCTQLHLDSGVQRHGAHRFYLRERMDITCYHFRREL
ncbi:MAG: GNAT family N-acetyltransferase [Herminiimonas sp.]|nr:GNAT family N-acetyltransferase [Herminiimonas sp.]